MPDAGRGYAVARRPVGPPRRRAAVRSREWAPEQVLDAIRAWTRAHGEPPRTLDWDPARATRLGQPWRAERFRTSGRWPSTRVVTGMFGSFNAAVAEAGERPAPAPTRRATRVAGPDAVLEALREWSRRHGTPPAMADWDPSRARRLGQAWRVERFYDGDWPNIRTVFKHFGSLSAAVEAAGLPPRA